jgi:tetratricopeptide (TPR) repeat protein
MAFVNSLIKKSRLSIAFVALTFVAGSPGLMAQLDGPVWSNRTLNQSVPPVPGNPVGPAFQSGAPGAVSHRAGGFSIPAEASPDVAARQGKLAEALSQVRALQRAEPNNVGHRIREARYLSWLGRHYTSANRSRAILREHPNHVEALTAYGTELYWQGNWREAQSVFAQAIKLGDDNDISPRLGYLKVLYTVAANSSAKTFYSFGDENATTLVQDLIGDKNFQSGGIELRLGINQHWAIIPSYRFERHNLFDLHAVALALNRQF